MSATLNTWINQESKFGWHLWNLAGCRQQYLASRTAPFATTAATALFQDDLRLKILDYGHIAALLRRAEVVAQSHWRNRKRQFHSHTTTPWENWLQTSLERELAHVLDKQRSLLMYSGAHKRQIAAWVPDLLIVGIPSIKIKVRTHNGSKLVQRHCMALAIEVNGKVHDRQSKIKKDNYQEDCLAELGILTVPISNDAIGGPGMVEAWALKTITKLALGANMPGQSISPPRAESFLRRELAIDLKTVSTYLTLEDADVVLRDEFGRDFGLVSGFQFLTKKRSNRSLARTLQKSWSARRELCKTLPNRETINQLNRHSLPSKLIDAETI